MYGISCNFVVGFSRFLGLKVKYRTRLFKSRREALAFVSACLALGVVWDSYAIIRGHWSFGEQYFTGIKIGVMPIEEYLFILVIPFSVVVLYEIVKKK